ncbi:hypothetical protein ACFQZZ_00715 [Nocardia sp. GCM10030253]|uniref:hypothetical protein n=1 Tax=Nocardia sp. GCM10030253 TaxID=3273404 RepID=UPI00363BF069
MNGRRDLEPLRLFDSRTATGRLLSSVQRFANYERPELVTSAGRSASWLLGEAGKPIAPLPNQSNDCTLDCIE